MAWAFTAGPLAVLQMNISEPPASVLLVDPLTTNRETPPPPPQNQSGWRPSLRGQVSILYSHFVHCEHTYLCLKTSCKYILKKDYFFLQTVPFQW